MCNVRSRLKTVYFGLRAGTSFPEQAAEGSVFWSHSHKRCRRIRTATMDLDVGRTSAEHVDPLGQVISQDPEKFKILGAG